MERSVTDADKESVSVVIDQLIQDFDSFFNEVERESDSLDMLIRISNRRKELTEMLDRVSQEKLYTSKRIRDLEDALNALHIELDDTKGSEPPNVNGEVINEMKRISAQMDNTQKQMEGVQVAQDKLHAKLKRVTQNLEKEDVDVKEVLQEIRAQLRNQPKQVEYTDILDQLNQRLDQIEETTASQTSKWDETQSILKELLNQNRQSKQWLEKQNKELFKTLQSGEKQKESLSESIQNGIEEVRRLDFVKEKDLEGLLNEQHLESVRENIEQIKENHTHSFEQLHNLIDKYSKEQSTVMNDVSKRVEELASQKDPSPRSQEIDLDGLMPVIEEMVEQLLAERDREVLEKITKVQTELSTLQFLTKEDLNTINPPYVKDLKEDINDLKDTHVKSVGKNEFVVGKVDHIAALVEALHSKVNEIKTDGTSIDNLKKLIQDVNQLEEKIVNMVSGIKKEAKPEAPALAREGGEDHTESDIESSQAIDPLKSSTAFGSANSWFYDSVKNAQNTQMTHNPYSNFKTNHPTIKKSSHYSTGNQSRKPYPNKPANMYQQNIYKHSPPRQLPNTNVKHETTKKPIPPNEPTQAAPPSLQNSEHELTPTQTEPADTQQESNSNNAGNNGNGSSFFQNVKKFFTE